MKYAYHPASPDELDQLWARTIASNPGDDRWKRWRDEYIQYNQTGAAKTFVVTADGIPVGEGTLLLSPDCAAIHGRLDLADGKNTANINALRIHEDYEGKGHISHLVKQMEAWAKEQGIATITIGVEAQESRNLGIYLHWGYQRLVCHDIENGVLVLYYAKDISCG